MEKNKISKDTFKYYLINILIDIFVFLIVFGILFCICYFSGVYEYIASEVGDDITPEAASGVGVLFALLVFAVVGSLFCGVEMFVNLFFKRPRLKKNDKKEG
jgi:hypothetical protein